MGGGHDTGGYSATGRIILLYCRLNARTMELREHRRPLTTTQRLDEGQEQRRSRWREHFGA